MMIKTLICFALSLVLWLPSWIKGPTTNAQDVKASGLDWSAGADEVVVEIPAQSGRTLQLAAGELVRYFRKMTQDRLDISISRSALQTQGAALRVVSRRRKAADPAKETGIAVGGASDPDAYAIRVADGVLHIDGVSERAVLYGVYDVLERFGRKHVGRRHSPYARAWHEHFLGRAHSSAHYAR